MAKKHKPETLKDNWVIGYTFMSLWQIINSNCYFSDKQVLSTVVNMCGFEKGV